jgi:hypothetical protein
MEVRTMAEKPSRAEVMGHEEIVKSFLGSNAVDFRALGNFVAEYGESIAISGRGEYGVRIGHYNILACFKIATPVFNPVDVGGIAPDVVGP